MTAIQEVMILARREQKTSILLNWHERYRYNEVNLVICICGECNEIFFMVLV